MRKKTTKINVQGTAITILKQDEEDYISLTNMVQKFGDDNLIYSWMRNRNTLEFLGIWEQIHNPDFNSLEIEGIKNEAGRNSFHLTPKKWYEATNAIGIISKARLAAELKIFLCHNLHTNYLPSKHLTDK